MFSASHLPLSAVRFLAAGCLALGSLWGAGACRAPTEDATPATVMPATPSPTATPTWVPVPTFTVTPRIRIVAAAPTGTPEPTPTPRRHRVESGDTLIGIAYRYGVTVDDVRTANRIRDDRLLQIGQVLTIPSPVREESAQGTPTPLAHALVQTSAAVDGAGLAWIMGRVANQASVPVEQVRVVARWLNDAGEEVARARSLALRHIVPAGATAPFMMQVGTGAENGSQWELSVATSLPAYVGGYHLDLAVAELRFRPFVGRAVTVEGQVANRGQATALAAEVVVLALNDGGQVIGMRVLSPVPATLAPGQTGEFAGTVFALGSDVASVEAFAQGITE